MKTPHTWSLSLILAGLFAAAGCGPAGDQLGTRVTDQADKVTTAEVSLAKEQVKLITMRDSLEVRVARNVAIGMHKNQARSVEMTLLKAQKAVVRAEEINLTTQREYLALLKKQVAARRSQ